MIDQTQSLLNDTDAAHFLRWASAGAYGGTPPSGYVYAAPGDRVGAALLYRLPARDPMRRYQVWLIRPDGDRDSGGPFTADDQGEPASSSAPRPLRIVQRDRRHGRTLVGQPRADWPHVIGGPIR